MKPPLPPDLLALGEDLERRARRQVVDRPVRRQLTLNILATFAITVPMAISVTGAELSRPLAERPDPPRDTTTSRPAPAAFTMPLAASGLAPQALRRRAPIASTPTPEPMEPPPLRRLMR